MEFQSGVVALERAIRGAINSAARKAIPRKIGRGRRNRWWDKELADMKRKIVLVKSKLTCNRENEKLLSQFRLKRREYNRLRYFENLLCCLQKELRFTTVKVMQDKKNIFIPLCECV